jgi:hypothetical protein
MAWAQPGLFKGIGVARKYGCKLICKPFKNIFTDHSGVFGIEE